MSTRNRDRSEAGFTLVELMIASLVLMVGMLSVMSMLLFALSANYTSRIESAALNLSEQKMEELKALLFNDPKLAGPGNPLDSQYEINFSASAVSQYTSSTNLLLNVSKNTTISFETRWNISALGSPPIQRIITVATRNTGGSPFRLKPVSLKVVKSRDHL